MGPRAGTGSLRGAYATWARGSAYRTRRHRGSHELAARGSSRSRLYESTTTWGMINVLAQRLLNVGHRPQRAPTSTCSESPPYISSLGSSIHGAARALPNRGGVAGEGGCGRSRLRMPSLRPRLTRRTARQAQPDGQAAGAIWVYGKTTSTGRQSKCSGATDQPSHGRRGP